MPACILFPDNVTAFGTAITLVVLCVVSTDSNFIHKTLEEIRKQIKRQIEMLTITVSPAAILGSDKYHILRQYRQLTDSKPNLSPEEEKLRNECYQWQTVEYQKFESQSSITVSIDDRNECEEMLQQLNNGKETKLAPLYTFIFAIFALLADALLPAGRAISEICINLLGLYLIFSIIYWALVWTRYMLPSSLTLKKGDFKKGIDAWCEQRHLWQRAIAAFFWYAAIVVTVIGIADVIISVLFVSAPDYWALTLLGALIAAVLFGLFWVCCRNLACRYQYPFVIHHTIFFCILSAALLIACRCFGSSLDILPFGIATDGAASGRAILVFTAVNGLLLPFLLPYLKFSLIYYRIKQKVADRVKAVVKLRDDAEDHLISITDRIKSLDSTRS